MNPLELIDKWIQERGSAAIMRERLELLRDQIKDMEARHGREIAELKATHEKELTAVKAQLAQPRDALPRTQRDLCPHCQKPRGRQVAVRPDRPPSHGHTETYECGACGESYEKHSP